MLEVQNLSMVASMSSADLTHRNGFGAALWWSRKAFIAASSSSTLRCTPRLICFSVSSAECTKAGQAFVTRVALMLLGTMGMMVAAAGIGFLVLVILAMSGNLQGRPSL